MTYKRVTLICGHYGSGKTNVAVNMAFDLKEKNELTAIADLDIVNPYFRTQDSEQDFKEKGIRLICSSYANTNIDAPAIPQEIYSIIDEKEQSVIVDVGGDDRGALALGRISEALQVEDNYDMYMVINKYRPLTREISDLVQIKEEIELAGRIKFTGLVNNSNIGKETTAEVVLASMEYAREASKVLNLPLVLTSYDKRLDEALKGKIEKPFPMKLQKTPLDS